MGLVAWLSLDPTHCRVVQYPSHAAERLEAAHQDGATTVVLGATFYNATVHLRGDKLFQTTPAQHFGRSGGIKPAGYRSVCRLPVESPGRIALEAFQTSAGEWRFWARGVDSEAATKTTVMATVTAADATAADALTSRGGRCGGRCGGRSDPPRAWTRDDLAGAADGATTVVVWQWSRKRAPVHDVDEDDWERYDCDHAAAIERAWLEEADSVVVMLGRRALRVCFLGESMFALQKTARSLRERLVRRVVTTVSALQCMSVEVPNFAAKGVEACLPALLATGVREVPPAFLCPIRHEKMRVPVIAVDGHTYEREAIETWLATHKTSPMTGAVLRTHHLVPNDRLLEQMALLNLSP